MESKYIGSIDQGTTSSRFILFDKEANIIASAQKEHKQIMPEPGYVEHDSIEIIDNVKDLINKVFDRVNIRENEVSSIGITNQRETFVLWNKKTGIPYSNAIVWQDTRSMDLCREYENKFTKDFFIAKTGLPISTYFSASKLAFLINADSGLREKINNNEILFGTMDTWLIWNLTGGIQGGIHVTDVTNASRTLLMNLETLNWDQELLDIFGINSNLLPEILPSFNTDKFGLAKIKDLSIPIGGVLGDQQAALFGQTCFTKGELKNTYGTGCFALVNTGEEIKISDAGLLTTLAFQDGDSKPLYALEGSVAMAGASVQWLRDNLGLIKESSEIEQLASGAEDNGGVYFVPAFSGLFAPYWRDDARGVIVGLTRYANKHHIARAVLESTAFQTKDLLLAMEKDLGHKIKSIKIDGGMVFNNLLTQFQSDILNTELVIPTINETTCLGAAFASGLTTSFWGSMDELKSIYKVKSKITPKMDEQEVNQLYNSWEKAITKTFNWV
ncbi:UNVERIFIED_CONTAM: hypothetical protein GTU68_029361 [Idotea baltica]|nr:hypothetical protein [Idotea baltica]